MDSDGMCAFDIGLELKRTMWVGRGQVCLKVISVFKLQQI